MGGKNCTMDNYELYLRLHVTPFPVNPSLQVQVKLPSVLSQAALLSQLLAPLEHSSISDVGKGNNCIVDNHELLTNTCDTISSVSRVTGKNCWNQYIYKS